MIILTRTILPLFLLCLLPCSHGAEIPLIAHRGASHDAPENTLAAFQLAWKQGADGIEGDFRLTADGTIVCVHDTTMKRTAGRTIDVATSTFEALRQLDVGAWKGDRWKGQTMPTLTEVLSIVPAGKLFYIELKSGPEIVGPLTKIITASRLPRQQLRIIAFNETVIRACKKALPDIKAYWLTGYSKNKATGQWTPDLKTVLATLRRCHADGLGSNAHESLGHQAAQSILDAGFELHVWTIDDPRLAKTMRERGAQSITTNRPQWLRGKLH